MVAHTVIPATQEVEAGELLKPLGGRGCSELRSGLCAPAWVRLHLKKKRIKDKINFFQMYKTERIHHQQICSTRNVKGHTRGIRKQIQVKVWFYTENFLNLIAYQGQAGAVAHTCNPALREDEAGGSPEVRSLRPAWTIWWNSISSKNTKISWVWWRAPIVPATWEAEAGELLELRRKRLQWDKIMPLHSSLSNRGDFISGKWKKICCTFYVLNVLSVSITYMSFKKEAKISQRSCV